MKLLILVSCFLITSLGLAAEPFEFKLVKEFASGPQSWGHAEFSKNGDYLLVGDYYADKLFLWNVNDLAKPRFTYSSSSFVDFFDIAQSEGVIALLDDKVLKALDAKTGETLLKVKGFDCTVMSLKLSHDGHYVGIGAADVKEAETGYMTWIYNIKTKKLIYSFDGSRDFVFDPKKSEVIHSFKWNEGRGRTLARVDLQTLKRSLFDSPILNVNWLQISNDGDYLYNRMRPVVVSAIDGKFAFKPKERLTSIFDFSSKSGRYLLGRSNRKPAILIDMLDKSAKGPFVGSRGEGASASCLTLSDDEKWLFVAGQQGLSVFDIKTQKLISHDSQVVGCSSMSINSEMRRIVVVEPSWIVKILTY